MFDITESLVLHVRPHVQILVTDGELFLLAPKVHHDHHLPQDIARLRLPFKVWILHICSKYAVEASKYVLVIAKLFNIRLPNMRGRNARNLGLFKY